MFDKRRGLHSYEALATRLRQNEFDRAGTDMSGPVLELKPLTPEDLYVLLVRIRDVFARGDSAEHLLPDEGLHSFLEYSRRRLGESFFSTPRDTVTRFVGLLQLLESDPDHDWRAALGMADGLEAAASTSAEAHIGEPIDDEDSLVEFKV